MIREGRLLISDSTEHLGHTDARRVRIRGISSPPTLPDVKDVQTDADTVSFLYGGNSRELLQALSALPLTDVSITEPDLDEIFMHFYAEGEN